MYYLNIYFGVRNRVESCDLEFNKSESCFSNAAKMLASVLISPKLHFFIRKLGIGTTHTKPGEIECDNDVKYLALLGT